MENLKTQLNTFTKEQDELIQQFQTLVDKSKELGLTMLIGFDYFSFLNTKDIKVKKVGDALWDECRGVPYTQEEQYTILQNDKGSYIPLDWSGWSRTIKGGIHCNYGIDPILWIEE